MSHDKGTELTLITPCSCKLTLVRISSTDAILDLVRPSVPRAKRCDHQFSPRPSPRLKWWVACGDEVKSGKNQRDKSFLEF